MSPINPWAKGQTSPTWTITMTRDGGSVMDLTGVTVSQLSLNIYGSNGAQIGTGAGTFTIVSANPGVVRYHPAAADSATVGNNSVRVVVDYNNVDPDMSDLIPWSVAP